MISRTVLQSFLVPVSEIRLRNHSTRYSLRDRLYRPIVRTNYGLFTFLFFATQIWDEIPTEIK